MAKERGIFRMMFKSFIASFKQPPKPQLMGTDYNKTMYYEQHRRDDGVSKRSHRYFVPPEKDDFTQDIPSEWEAWLRHRRKEPPTEEEVNKSRELMLQTKKNAAELRKKYLEAKGIKSDTTVKDQQVISAFPNYSEYENHGENYEVKIKDKK